MAFELYREPLYRRYYATYTSAAFCYALAIGFLLVFLPLILAYNSEGFWYTQGTYFEQPMVNYRYQSVVELHGVDTSDSSAFSLYYSTSSNLKAAHGASVRAPLLQSATFDHNRDGRADRIDIQLAMPLKPTEQISGMSALFLYDVKLQQRAKVQFDAAAHVSYDSGAGMSALRVDGDIELRQTWPLQVKGGLKEPYGSLLPVTLPQGTSEADYSTAAILETMAARNLSTTFAQTYAVAEHALAGGAPVNHDVRYFNATVSLRVPEQQVWYTPGVSEVLKWAWVQYLSLFVVVAFLVNRLTSFVFRHQLLHAYSTADVVTEKMD